jgi:hypothetical protein
MGVLSLNQVTSGLGKPENVHSRTAGCSTLTVTSEGLPSTFGLPEKKRKTMKRTQIIKKYLLPTVTVQVVSTVLPLPLSATAL